MGLGNDFKRPLRDQARDANNAVWTVEVLV
jgi:hypothetical protein